MGKLVVLEGLDGSGKATQAALLLRALEGKGLRARRISFPDYEQPSSALVRMYLAGEFGAEPGDVNAYAASSFYAVDRFASYRKFWKREYDGGAAIVADRYVTSNLIYQLAKLPRAEWDAFLRWEEDYEYGPLGLPRPELTVYLAMPVEISQGLLSGRYGGREEKKDIHEKNVAYLADCRAAAAYAAQRCGWLTVSCAESGHPKAVEEIHGEIMRLLEDRRFYAGISRDHDR